MYLTTNSSWFRLRFIFSTFLYASVSVVSGVESQWVYGRISNLSSMIASTDPSCLYQTSTRLDCFLYCSASSECHTVIVTTNKCCCRKELAPYSVQNDTLAYFKRPVGVCETPDYIYYKDICFRRGTTNKTWNEAQVDCKLTGGHLIVLDSQEKLQNIVSILKTSYPYTSDDDHYFVGANDIETEGDWKWITDKASNFTKFRNGQPNNIDSHYPGQQADCASLRLTFEAMVDEYCAQTKSYVCEEIRT